MFCPRCGKSITTGAAFCMFCGQPIARVSVPGPGAAPARHPAGVAPADAFDADHQNLRKLGIVAAGLILLCVLVLGLGSASFLHLFSSDKSGNGLLKSAGGGPAILQKVATNSPAPLEKNGGGCFYAGRYQKLA